MAFTLEKTQESTFEDIDAVLAHVKQEKENIARISIADLVKKGAFFFSDQYFGSADLKLKFNKPAFDDLFSVLGFYSPSFLDRIEKTDLASDVLNDLVRSKTGQDKLQNSEFVYDDASKTILGVVSKSYVGYSNKDFLADILNCLSSKKSQQSLFSDLEDFKFVKSYSTNTHLHLRLLHKKMTGVIRGKGGEGEDKSELGLQLSNAMSGGKALKMDYFVHRLVCANGLILPVGGVQARLIHTGDNFHKRLSAKMTSVIGSLSTAKNTIETLGGVNFDPEEIANYPDLKKLFTMIPERNLKQEATTKFSEETLSRLQKFKKEKLEYQTNVEIIKQIPSLIGGKHSDNVFKSTYRDNKTMFDFINVITEEAHNYKRKPQQRLHIEKEAGNLADFIAKNRKLF